MGYFLLQSNGSVIEGGLRGWACFEGKMNGKRHKYGTCRDCACLYLMNNVFYLMYAPVHFFLVRCFLKKLGILPSSAHFVTDIQKSLRVTEKSHNIDENSSTVTDKTAIKSDFWWTHWKNLGTHPKTNPTECLACETPQPHGDMLFVVLRFLLISSHN